MKRLTLETKQRLRWWIEETGATYIPLTEEGLEEMKRLHPTAFTQAGGRVFAFGIKVLVVRWGFNSFPDIGSPSPGFLREADSEVW